MRLCHLVPSLEERHGGPSKSVRALANAEAACGASVDLLFTASPGAPERPSAADAATWRAFPREFPAGIYRAPALDRHLQSTPYACVHSHALWIRTLHYAARSARRHGVPLVISPRGMMSPWAMQYHRWRKKLAAACIHPGAFRAAAGWHATSPEEADDIRRLGFAQPVCVAPNGVTLPDDAARAQARAVWHERLPATRNRRVALFYSRFHRKKRVRELLDLWLAADRGDWLLVLAGVPEEYSVAEIQSWVSAAGADSRVAVADGAGLPPPYAAASLFVLPSHSENFGLVIAEAMAAGVPVLVTDGTPWSGVAGREAGWCVPWADYASTLAAALGRASDDLAARGAHGRRWMSEEYSWEGAARRLLAFYRQLSYA